MGTYREDLEIDKFALDEAWETQALRFCDWAEKEVEAQFERDKAKEKLDIAEASTDTEIRKDPSKFGIDKVTETAIKNAVLLHKTRTEAQEKYLNAVRSAKILSVAREAFDHRKKALEKLTELYFNQYWSEPKESTGIRKGKEEQVEKGRDEHYQSLEKIIKRRPPS